jgi:hypothetical protein
MNARRAMARGTDGRSSGSLPTARGFPKQTIRISPDIGTVFVPNRPVCISSSTQYISAGANWIYVN